MSALFLLTLHLVPVVWNAPLVAWHYRQYTERKHWYDPTEIFRRLPEHKRECFIKLAFYLLSFFYYLYRMIMALMD